MNRLINDISGNNPRRLTRTTLALGAFLAILMAAAPAVHAQDGPVIDVWYGLSQQFGDPGEPQIWCDIQGNVSDPDGVSSLSYTLNGGASVDLTIGTDGRRLITPGDFIVDLLVADLLVGANSVVITAVDGLSNVNTETVTLTYSAGNSWPTNYATDWGSLTTDGNPLTPDPAILEQAHVVDGKWTVVGDSIRTIEPGYDRLIGIGELGWGDYEVTVPVTIHNILDVGEFGVGLIFRWNGHTNDPDYCDQPLCGWKPLGDIGWLKNGRLNLWDHDINSSMTVNLDTVYWLKMRVETDAGGAQYSLKAWEDGQAEPAWMITDTKPANSPMAGSLLLVAHEAEASFGNVTIVDVTGPNVAPVANDFTVNAKFDGISLLSVHLNDTDSDGVINPASVSIVAPPADGTATVDPVTGIVEYLHGGGPNPTDTFTYTVEDNDGATSNVATVNLTIVPNQLPTANDDSAGVKVAESVDIDVAANDTDSDGTIDRTTVSIEDNPLHGTILAVHPTTGVITYAQDLGAAAADSFTYTVDDNDGATSNIATVVITITPNVAPTANDDDAFVAFNSTVMIDVTANDTDSDGVIDPTTVAIVDPPFNGTPSIDPVSGVVTYIHTALTAEPDSFTYTVQDDTGDLSNPAMVRINVGPEPPEDFFSDDFNSCGLDPMWTFIDPLGDAPAPVIVGAFSGDAQVAISVPGGISHEPYNGVINAPYILQASQ
ncbi:MAG: Ig-like domain-containing protein, partial [Candidatus Krumholzibacteriota bacterium]